MWLGRRSFRALLFTAFITYWQRGRTPCYSNVELTWSLLREDKAWRCSETESTQLNRPRVDDQPVSPFQI